MSTKAEREAALHALRGERECEQHPGTWLPEGESCKQCLVRESPFKLLNQLVDLALNTKPVDTRELLINAGLSVLSVQLAKQNGDPHPFGLRARSLSKLTPARRRRPVKRKLRRAR